MTRDEELALIAEHVRTKGVTRPTGLMASDILPLANVFEAMEWARRNGVKTRKFHDTGRISINGGPAVQGSRFVAHINAIRARSLGMAVRSDASMLPGTRV